MKKLTLFSLLLTLGLLFGAEQAKAQAQIQLGPRVGYDIDDLESLSVGADVRISTLALPVQINPTFDYFFMDDAENDLGDDVGRQGLQFTANALYTFGVSNRVFTPYAGPGVSYTRLSYDGDFDADDVSDVGLNLVGGAEFGVGPLRAFGQAEFVVGGEVQPVKVVGGLLFNF